jgi:hypothetical protein
MKNVCAFSLLVPVLALSACVADATSSEGDDIVAGHQASKYHEAVLVEMVQGGARIAACSGALVAPQVVLTAGHCVARFDDFVVTAPFANGQSSTASRRATYDWHAQGEAVDPSAHDVGLIFLDTPIQLPSYPKLAHAPVAEGTKLVNVGRIHSGHLSDDALYYRAVEVEPAASFGFPFDYAAVDVIESGDSGGPDFVAGKGEHTIAAVNSGADGHMEVLARVDLVAPWIEAAIAGKHAPAPPQDAPKACAHDVCATGKKLSPSCDPCAAAVCGWDPTCCDSTWDGACVETAALLCGASCP